MTRRRVTDEQSGRLNRRLRELERRVDEDTLDFDRAMDLVQRVIETRNFTVDVDYPDPFLQSFGEIEKRSTSLEWHHFSMSEKGKATIVMELISFVHDPMTPDILKAVELKGLRLPTFQEARAFLKQYPEVLKRRINMLCGVFYWQCHYPSLAILCVENGKIWAEWKSLHEGWHDGGVFLTVVCREER